MVSKLFLDINVVLDYVLERPGELKEIEEIFDLADNGKLSLYFSESVISTTIYFLQKLHLNAVAIIRELCTCVEVLPFKTSIVFERIESYNDLEDALLYFLAAEGKMDFFITRNTSDFTFTIPALTVLSPAKFIKKFHDLPQ